ncbi:peptidoglycan-recognition protein SC2-like 1 [Homarus americanus]|uniref:Peptidoglycan-recognition protein SC2-like 1 n=1 Tax=Homarus americanus TaxID=6706 RepID=A0A8J5JHD9_HOMAM|nr:peptidoglycan-recognition protein SC2-like 1 [Homarus americanus]
MLKMYAVIAVGLVVLHQGQCQPVPGCCYCVDDSGNNVTAFWSAQPRRTTGRPHRLSHNLEDCLVTQNLIKIVFPFGGNESTGIIGGVGSLISGLEQRNTRTIQLALALRQQVIRNLAHLNESPMKSPMDPERPGSRQSTYRRVRHPSGDCSRLQFVTRAEWGARDPVSREPIIPPFSGVFVHHSAMARCNTSEECVAEVQEIQKLHMDKNGWDDIGYHFLVGEDGRVYEGRGWNARGAHARAHNAWTYGICVMGNYVMALPNDRALTALRDIMDCGVKQGKITQGFEVFGHRDGVCTECPGQMLYEEIQTWPYYSHRTIPIYC